MAEKEEPERQHNRPEDQPDEPGAEGGSRSPAADKLPGRRPKTTPP